MIPRDEFKRATKYGDMADALVQLDTDFGAMLDFLEELGVADDTIVVFSGDNGAEGDRDYRGNSGFFNGSYFTGSEGALRTPAIVRYPGHVPGGQQTDDPVHITDMFTTLVRWAGAEVPDDRTIDGKDQCDFFEGKAETSAREGFLFWNGPTLYGVKWQHYKLLFRLQTYMFEPVQTLATPWVINLKAGSQGADALSAIPNVGGRTHQ